MALRVTRRDVTAALALSCLSGVVRGRAVSAQWRGASLAIGDRVNRLERQLEDLRGTLKIPGISAAVVKGMRGKPYLPAAAGASGPRDILVFLQASPLLWLAVT